MSYFNAQVEVEKYIRSNFSDVPIVVENQSIPSQGSYLLFQFLFTQEDRVDMGAVNGRYRTPVTLFAQLYTPRDVGWQSATKTADKFAKLLRGQTIGPVVIRSCGVQKAADDGNSPAFFQLNIVGNAYFDFFEND